MIDEAIQVVIEIGQGGDHNPAEISGHIADSSVTPATSAPPKQQPGSGKCAGYYSLVSPLEPHLLSVYHFDSTFYRFSSLHDLRRLSPGSLTYTAAGENIIPLHCVLNFDFLRARSVTSIPRPVLVSSFASLSRLDCQTTVAN